MNSEDRQFYSVCILQLSCFTKYNRMQSKHKQTKCEHSGITKLNQRNCKKKIPNSSLNFHVYWDTLYISMGIRYKNYVCPHCELKGLNIPAKMTSEPQDLQNYLQAPQNWSPSLNDVTKPSYFSLKIREI